MPELLLFVGAMGLLMFGVFTPPHKALMISRGAIVLLIAAMLAVALQNGGELKAFNNGFVADSFTAFM
ncbi:MAG: NADH-quinone oxidoreductase subunit N, partial [Alphaproteobacteria bacterium]|nr:NADH-quinone oxidoreductase subunit N [Alphaproteobacteria bacterium]